MRKYINSSKHFVNKFIKLGFLQAFPFWIASIVTGVIAVGYAMLFAKAEELHLFINGIKDWSIFIVTPLCFLLAWWLVKKWAPNAKGSGIPQVMAAIDLATPNTNSHIDKLLSIRIVVVKIFSSLIMVAGGAAIGREGPTIQIAGSVFYAINKLTPKSWPKLSKQSFILTGAAAGLAAAFNTPLGGLVFAMEELAKVHIRYFRTALFSAVIIAGLTAQAIAGPYLYIGYPVVSNLKFVVFFGVALAAILAGFGGAFMSRLILYLLSIRSKIKGNFKNILFITGAGLFMATVAFFINAEVMGSGKDIMTRVLFTSDKHEEWYTVVLRIIGPAISFSTGGAGGVFAPALAAGASIGAYLAGLFELAGANANILILGGMVGFLTGLTRSPFTSAILVLEMTDRHSVIFHLLLAAMLAQVAALLIDRRSLYDHLKKQYLQAEEILASDVKPGKKE
ncbi:MAG: chloride channel protein [Chitinophagaceae bacterium]